MDDAYAIQAALGEEEDRGGPQGDRLEDRPDLQGHAICAQHRHPDSGVLFDDMVFEDGATVPPDRFIQPRIEAEIAFVMKAPLKGRASRVFDVLNATDYMTPALEILDTRIVRVDPETKKARTIFDTISDNAANAGIVIGGRADAARPDRHALDGRDRLAQCRGRGDRARRRRPQPSRHVASPGLPTGLRQYGDGIEAGQIVLAGSFIRPIEARHGDTIVADFGPYGTVSLYFA